MRRRSWLGPPPAGMRRGKRSSVRFALRTQARACTQDEEGEETADLARPSRRKSSARVGLMLPLALVVLAAAHPDGLAHPSSIATGIHALLGDLGGRAEDPGCVICRASSQLRSALHDPAAGCPLGYPSARHALDTGDSPSPGAPLLRGPSARAPPLG